MNLQWDILLTQAVGFLIVMWLLRKYAWGKLLAFIEKRRETIAASFDEIEQEKNNVGEIREKLEKCLSPCRPFSSIMPTCNISHS